MSASKPTRSSNSVYLVGVPYSQILGAKLPSRKQVLSVFFFNHRVIQLTLRESATLVVEELSVFWTKARIPIRAKARCIDKVLSLHTEWLNLQKSSYRQSDAQKNKEETFIESLEDLFDVASESALTTMKIEEDKQFLISQRKKGRPGSMIGVDAAALQKEKRCLRRLQEEAERKRRYETATSTASTSTNVGVIQTDTDSENSELIQTANDVVEDTDMDMMNADVVDDANVATHSRGTRGKVSFINERIVSALDK